MSEAPFPGAPGQAEPTDAGKANARRSPQQRQGRGWRAILAIFLLVMGCVLLPFAVTGGWVRGTIFDSEGFVDTLAPLAENEAIQRAVAEGSTERLFRSGDIEARIEELLPNALGFLAPTVTESLRAWTLDAANRVVASDQFSAIWRGSLERLHPAIVGFLDGTGRVQLGEEGVIQLDLSELSTRLLAALEERGITVSEDRFPIVASGKVPLAQVKGLERGANILSGLNTLFIVLPILAVLFLVASVLVASRRRKALVRAGVGIMIAMAVFIVILFIVRIVLLNRMDDAGFAQDAAAVVWGSLTIALRSTLWGLFFVGLLLAIIPRFIARLGSGADKAAGHGADKGDDVGPAGRWAAAHRTMLAIVILILGFLVLALWNTPPLWAVIFVAAAVIVLVGLVFLVARQGSVATQPVSESGPGEER